MKTLILALALLFTFPVQAIETITEDKVNLLLQETKVPIVIDVYATWCGPCKIMTPMLEKAEKSFAGKVKFFKIDIDKNPELKKRITSVPTLLLLEVRGTKVFGTVSVGVPSTQKDLEDSIKKTFSVQ